MKKNKYMGSVEDIPKHTKLTPLKTPTIEDIVKKATNLNADEFRISKKTFLIICNEIIELKKKKTMKEAMICAMTNCEHNFKPLEHEAVGDFCKCTKCGEVI